MENKIIGTVRHNGETFGPGQEEDFEAVAKELGKDDVQRLADKGVIEGFGADEASDDEKSAAKKPGKKKTAKK